MRGSQLVLLITELAPRAREIGFGSGREKPVYKQGIRLSVNSKSFTSLKLKRLSTSIAVRADNIRVALILAPNTRTIIFTGMWQALFLRSLACAVVPACVPGPQLSSVPCYSSHPWYKGTVKVDTRHGAGPGARGIRVIQIFQKNKDEMIPEPPRTSNLNTIAMG